MPHGPPHPPPLFGHAVVVGRLLERFGHFGKTATVWDLIPPTAVIGAAMGLVFGPLFRTILGGVSQREVGSASGTLTANPAHTTSGALITALVIGATVALSFVLVFLLPSRPQAGRR